MFNSTLKLEKQLEQQGKVLEVILEQLSSNNKENQELKEYINQFQSDLKETKEINEALTIEIKGVYKENSELRLINKQLENKNNNLQNICETQALYQNATWQVLYDRNKEFTQFRNTYAPGVRIDITSMDKRVSLEVVKKRKEQEAEKEWYKNQKDTLANILGH